MLQQFAGTVLIGRKVSINSDNDLTLNKDQANDDHWKKSILNIRKHSQIAHFLPMYHIDRLYATGWKHRCHIPDNNKIISHTDARQYQVWKLKYLAISVWHCVHPLRPGDVYMRQGSGSSFVHVMACRLIGLKIWAQVKLLMKYGICLSNIATKSRVFFGGHAKYTTSKFNSTASRASIMISISNYGTLWLQWQFIWTTDI